MVQVESLPFCRISENIFHWRVFFRFKEDYFANKDYFEETVNHLQAF